MVYAEREWVKNPDAWTDSAAPISCPTTLRCAVDPQKRLLDDVKCVPRAELLGALEVGEDGYGTRSFDNIGRAFYTMFILLSGDNGMQVRMRALCFYQC